MRLTSPTLFRLFSLLFILFLSTSAKDYKLAATYSIKGNSLGTDALGNVYLWSNNRLVKFQPDSTHPSANYEEFTYGKIGSVDLSNPMKTIVFYPDFMTVVVLDNFLAQLTTYRFFDLGFQSISAVCSSADGRIWFYDNEEMKLKKMDESGSIFRSSQPMNVVLGQVINPNFMLEHESNIYLNDPAVGILVFDIFGTYNKTIPIRNLRKFQVFQDQVIYFQNNRLLSYSSLSLDNKFMALPDTIDLVDATLLKNKLVLLKKEQVDFYGY